VTCGFTRYHLKFDDEVVSDMRFYEVCVSTCGLADFISYGVF